MKKNLLLTLVGLGLVACTHQTVATNPDSEYRTPAANNTGDVGSVGEKDLASTAAWYNKEIAKSHMQIAARMAQARQKGLICMAEVYHRDLVDNFQQAVLMDKNVVVDSDVKHQLANSMTYRVYLDEQKNPYAHWGEQLKRLNFDGLVWRALGQGAMGTTLILTQRANGVLEVSRMDIETTKWTTTQGSWKLGVYQWKQRPNGKYRPDAQVLYFTIDGKTRAYDIEFGHPGFELKLRSRAGQESPSFTDYINDECEA